MDPHIPGTTIQNPKNCLIAIKNNILINYGAAAAETEHEQARQAELQNRQYQRYLRVLETIGQSSNWGLENKYISHIYHGTLKARDLVNLQPVSPTCASSTSANIHGSMSVASRFESSTDFTDAFANYIEIWTQIFGNESPDVKAGMYRCLDHLEEWEETYPSDSIIDYALSYLNCALSRPWDPVVWNEFPDGEELVLRPRMLRQSWW